MKIMHISDLHIGKKVNGFSMIEDQVYILDVVLNTLVSSGAQVLLIAGDVYDTSVPSVEAVNLFNRFLKKVHKLKVTLIIISGNHDQVERLSFAHDLLAESDVFISPKYNKDTKCITLQDAYGDIHFYMLPFIKPIHVREALGVDVHTTNEAVKAAIDEMHINTGERNVLLAHQFITNALTSESEEVSVGGSDNVDAQHFDVFDYVALGHLHRAQYVHSKHIRYCGTLLKYSISERNHQKSITIVEVKEKGVVDIQSIEIKAKRDIIHIRGLYMEITSPSFYANMNLDDYYYITLCDEEDQLDALFKLRCIYPNIMQMDYDNKRTREHRPLVSLQKVETLSPLEMFEKLYVLQNNTSMSEEQEVFLKQLIEEIWEK